MSAGNVVPSHEAGCLIRPARLNEPGSRQRVIDQVGALQVQSLSTLSSRSSIVVSLPRLFCNVTRSTAGHTAAGACGSNAAKLVTVFPSTGRREIEGGDRGDEVVALVRLGKYDAARCAIGCTMCSCRRECRRCHMPRADTKPRLASGAQCRSGERNRSLFGYSKPRGYPFCPPMKTLS